MAFVPRLGLSACWGILVKLVICVSSGHLEFKIANFTQYVTFACFLPWSNTLSLENMMGSLIAPLTKLLYLINENSMSRGDIMKIMQCVWQGKSIYSTQMNCQRQYMMVTSIVGINHVSLVRIWNIFIFSILTQ